MSIWYERPTIEQLNHLISPKNFVLLDKPASQNLLVHRMGIEFTEVGDDYMEGRMPVDERTKQGFGVLHGGASTVLADTIGGIAANCTLNQTQFMCVTIELKTNITKAVREGYVTAFAKPLHIGKTTQVWSIHTTDDDSILASFTTMTMQVMNRERL